jgi:RNA polymerase-binding transcription factor DksA
MLHLMHKSTEPAGEQPVDRETPGKMVHGQAFTQQMGRALEKDLAWVNHAIGTLEDQARFERSGAGLPPGSETELDDSGTYSTMLVKLHRRARSLFQALQRIETGTYGVCLSCRQSIPVDQLRAAPERTVCLHCVRKRREDLARILSPTLPSGGARSAGPAAKANSVGRAQLDAACEGRCDQRAALKLGKPSNEA